MLEKVLRRAGSDAIKYLPVRFVPALTSLITVPVFTRLIGASDYGYFYLINSTTSLATSLALGWISSSAIRYYWAAHKEDRTDAYTATTMWITMFAALAMSLVLAAGFWLLRGRFDAGLLRLVPVGIASFAVSGLYTNLLQVLRAANKATSYAVLSVSMTLVTTALSLLFVWKQGWGALGILAGGLVGYAVLLPFVIRAVRREGSLGVRDLDRGLLGEFASYGVPLMLAGMSSWVLILSDRYVIGALRSASEVGMYSVAYGLGDKIMQLVMLPLLMTMSPMIIETFEREGVELAQRVQSQFTRYFAMVTVPLVAGMAIAGADFMRTFTGPAYRSAYVILPIIAAGVMCNGLAQLAGSGLGLYKRSQIIMTNTLAAAIFNVVANLLTVGRFGYMAAAFNTLAAYAVLLVLTWARTRAYMAWDIPWLDLVRISVSAGLMALALYFAFPNVSGSAWALLAQAGVGILVYAAVLVALGGFRKAELAGIAERLSRSAGNKG